MFSMTNTNTKETNFQESYNFEMQKKLLIFFNLNYTINIILLLNNYFFKSFPFFVYIV